MNDASGEVSGGNHTHHVSLKHPEALLLELVLLDAHAQKKYSSTRRRLIAPRKPIEDT
jgi:hypothetical protein